jgi:hypothetical protein
MKRLFERLDWRASPAWASAQARHGKVMDFAVNEDAFAFADRRFCEAFAAGALRNGPALSQARRWVIVNLYSLGDSYLLCALARKFREAHCTNGEELVMVVRRSHAAIAEMFARDFDIIGLANDGDLDRTVGHLLVNRIKCGFAPGEALFVHPHHMNDTRVDDFTNLEGVSQANMYANLLRLPIRAALSAPEIPESWLAAGEAAAKTLGMTKGRSVVLCPDSNSWPPVGDAFWERLAARLQKAGWSVFTNAYGTARGPRTAPLPGTRLADFPLKLALPVLSYGGWVIAALSGFINVVISAQTPCKKTVVVRGPGRRQELRFNDCISVRSAFPYAYQRKFDGFNYDIEEIQVRDDDDLDALAERVASGFNASFSSVAMTVPVTRAWVECTPGELVDKITVLEVKMEMLPEEKTRVVQKEVDILRETLASLAPDRMDELAPHMNKLRALNRIGWSLNELIYQEFDDQHFGTASWSLDEKDPAGSKRAAQCIRNMRASQQANRERILVKNEISRILGSSWSEKKSFHA